MLGSVLEKNYSMFDCSKILSYKRDLIYFVRPGSRKILLPFCFKEKIIRVIIILEGCSIFVWLTILLGPGARQRAL